MFLLLAIAMDLSLVASSTAIYDMRPGMSYYGTEFKARVQLLGRYKTIEECEEARERGYGFNTLACVPAPSRR